MSAGREDERSAEVWKQAAALFDQLAVVDAEARHSVLSSLELTPEVRAWLDKLLKAHDREQTALIDQQLTELVEQLVPSSRISRDAAAFYERRFGPWQTLHEIGRGGMGLVLEGRRADGQFDKRVAIKLLDPVVVGPNLARQLEHELRMLASLSHPAIAQLLDGGVGEDGVPYLVMEYVDGVPIQQYCEAHKLDLQQRLDLFLRVADAVSYCHRRLVVHGDIKPDNVLVDDEGQVKLLDFGIASRLAEGADSDTGRRIQRWCSPAYAAPERLRGEPPAVTEDVYALAALLYELVTGGRIRSAPEMTRWLAAKTDMPVLADRPLPIAQQARNHGRDRKTVQTLRGDLEAIFHHALAPNPAERYVGVDALTEDLKRWRTHYPVQARSGGRLYPARKWLRRNRVLASFAVLLLMALIVGSSAVLWQSNLTRQAAEQARLNAQQALTAQSAAEAALQRADAINRFLLDLFEAEITGLPPDQMPSTRQLVDQGIERTRDPQTGPPKLRVELMLTLANILDARYQIDDADALLNEAKQILIEHDIQAPEVLIQAAMLESDLARSRNNLDDSNQALLRAQDLLQQHQPNSLLLLQVQRDLAYIEMRRENWLEARRQLEVVFSRVDQRSDADDLKLRVAGDLAILEGRIGNSQRALEHFEQVLELKREQPDITPPSLSTTWVNIAGLHMSLGDFDQSMVAYQRVLDLLQPFRDRPAQQRATALKGLSDLHRIRGDFDDAEDYLQRSAEEWRKALNLAAVEDDFFIHYYQGQLLAEQQRWTEAIAALERAIERMQSGQEAPPHRIAEKQADIARFHCQLGDLQQASSWLDQAADVIDRTRSLAMAQAEARCALARADASPDPQLMPMSAIDTSAEAPGSVIRTARMELLRAELLMRQADTQGSTQLINSAQARLQALEVHPGHPLFQRIEQLLHVLGSADAS
ncbi:MAG: serine/threonine-protein kinase [Pseudomonadota bacterium]